MKYIIFDIDGVLADCSHRLHYLEGDKKDYEAFYKACADDKPIKETGDLFKLISHCGLYENSDVNLVLLTGRSECTREQTYAWIENHFGITKTWYILIMRKDNDHREDWVYKQEKAKEFGFENILFVFEDRKRVVDMWRENGVICYQTCDADY